MQNIAVLRLRSQQLLHPAFQQPEDLVAYFAAVQAQDYAGALWSLGVRLNLAHAAQVEQALESKVLLRTWAMRGTLHFVAAADIRWLLALLAPHILARNTRRYLQLELDEPTLSRSNDLLASALQGGKQLTRKALLAYLRQNGVSTEGQRAAYMLQRASLDGLICQGVMRRNDPTYFLLDNSFAPAKSVDREAALAELAMRYFTSRGPATLQDFIWWSGLQAAEARAGLAGIQSRLVQESFGGQPYWLSASTPVPQLASPTVHLLPGFDEFLISYRDRSASLDPHHVSMLDLGNGFASTVLCDGHVVGVWRRAFKKAGIVISCQPFTPFTPAEAQSFADAAQRFGKFLSLPVAFPLTHQTGVVA